MKIFNFLKKIIRSNKTEEIQKKKVTFSEIKDWIENRKKENKIKEREVIDSIKKKINSFKEQLRERANILENFDLESKKAEDRLKSIVEESRKKYIEFLEIFMRDLGNIEKEKLSEFVYYVNRIFLDFNKKSNMNYQRTTILIGKEMADIKDTLKNFSKEFIDIFNRNKNIIDLSKSIAFIKLKLNQINQIDKILKEIKEEILFIEKKTIDKKEDREKLLKEIEKIKKSPNYIDYLNKNEKTKFIEEEIKKDILSLKQIIDFKALTNFYHIFENEMEIVKEHKENFEESFKKDDGLRILNLLDTSKLNNNEIFEKIKHIKSRKEELKKNKQEIKVDETQNPNSEKNRISNEIEELNREKVKEEKRTEKIAITKKDLSNEIKQEFEKLNIELIAKI